ncbi:MAG: response regulator, partial [Candidatus Omnitrophota bacterium]
MLNLNTNHRHILIVDDEPLVRRSLSELLALSGYVVSSAGDGKEALEMLKTYHADVVITDIKMPQMDGIQLLKQIKNTSSDTPVILMTSYGSIENAVEAMKDGAYDYVTKPIVDDEIKIMIERLIKQRRLQEENIELKEQLSVAQRERFHGIVGKSAAMQKIYTLIE